MTSLKSILKKKGYVRIPLKTTKTNHLELKAKINGVKGRFILDTGASNSCVGTDMTEKFQLETQESKIKAAGAGASEMETSESKHNSLKIGKWKFKKQHIVVFDLTHVNTALENHGAKTVQGILGADVLNKGKAVIDYKNKCLYLKKLVYKY
ncbi:retropepsin-like aspartic protease [Urechidicola vernalis]|uniref:Retropepsin-like aspartic protease n=1 Tax=Urechidicola vernalis TaxID=3075600 RepID=A0ABU2YA31_9FLAO|nr:retropepsin-like aspartic protease [Urechidicola sp. P050]MDT0554110.1 retropepsin-like aspartic protease [Urechidicola sp. P050]